MALQDLIDLDTAAKAEHGKRPGELPCKYRTNTSVGLGTALAGHSPQSDLYTDGAQIWSLSQSGAHKVWREYINRRAGVGAELYTIGGGGDYATPSAFATALNAGTIGAPGSTITGEFISNVNDAATTVITSTNPSEIRFRSQTGQFQLLATGATMRLFEITTTRPIFFEDLLINGNGRSGATSDAIVFFNGLAGGSMTFTRCRVHNCNTTGRVALVGSNHNGSLAINMYSCILDTANSTRGVNDRNGAIQTASGPATINVDNVVIDNISNTTATAGVVSGISKFSSGPVVVTARNVSITRINGNSVPVLFSFDTDLDTVNQTTNATFDNQGSITGIDETEFVNAAGGNYRLANGSQLINAGTDVGGPASITFDSQTRSGLWDINAYDRDP